jgi:hypothetical protein
MRLILASTIFIGIASAACWKKYDNRYDFSPSGEDTCISCLNGQAPADASLM